MVKAGIQAKKKKMEKAYQDEKGRILESMENHKKIKSLSFESQYAEEFRGFMEILSKSNEEQIKYPDYLLSSSQFKDSENIKKMKTVCIDEFQVVFEKLSYTNGAHFALNYSKISKELCMLGSRKFSNNELTIINAGLDNLICIAFASKKRKGSDQGVTFCFAGRIPLGEKIHSCFGEIDYFDSLNEIVFISSWRRLKMEKLTFAYDVFYSTLATSIKNLLEIPNFKSLFLRDKLNHLVQEFYISRICAGLSLSQHVAELLADFKYIMMSSLSISSRTSELLLDKVKGPFTKHVDVFFGVRFFQSSLDLTKLIHEQKTFVEQEIPKDINSFEEFKRIGGNLSVPFMWYPEGFHTTINNFLDSVHLYVHTIKEPSSIYHEEVKSLNTIIKYDNIYKSLTNEEKIGEHEDLFSATKNNNMSFNAPTIFEACDIFTKLNPDLSWSKPLYDSIFTKPLSHFSSTKASMVTNLKPELAEQFSIRCKVCDSLLENNLRGAGYLDLHDNLIKHAVKYCIQDTAPLCDMCIKVQYGPKREFYVLDSSSKFAIKFVEEYMKLMCKQVPTECIHISGDLKLMKIQEMFNVSKKTAMFLKKNLTFINGDCSKWSASEMMEVFLTLILSFKKHIPEEMFKIIKKILLIWMKKILRVPKDIVEKNSKIGSFSEKTEYIQKLLNKDGLVLEQNFLMGIFNYLSSFKASVCYTYCKYLIEMWSNNQIKMFHLEHSDDYAMDLICQNTERVPAKTLFCVIMRLFNITDSSKKTVMNDWLKEFVSLFNFNGMMCYPQIKKVKEISTSVSGWGYFEDQSVIGSRVSEVIRVGCTSTVALLFLKLHNWLIQNLYSMNSGMTNDLRQFCDPYNIPAEIGGITEVWPLLYYISNGDPNNYRLALYAKETLPIFNYLAKLGDEIDINTSIKLAHIRFTSNYKTNNKLNTIMKRLQINHKENFDFIENHKSYKFIKPNQLNLQIPYLKSFYSMNTFKLAYERQSKLQTMLRIGGYIKNPVCHIGQIESSSFIFCVQTILEASKKYENYVYPEVFLTNADTTPQLFYELINEAKVSFTLFSKNKHLRTRCSYSPFYLDPIMFDTPIQYLIQYIFNYDDFLLDNHQINERVRIEEEAKLLKKMLENLPQLNDMEKILFAYNAFKANNKKLKVQISSSKSRLTIQEFINDHIRDTSSSKYKFQTKTNKSFTLESPFLMKQKIFVYKSKTMNSFKATALTIYTIYCIYSISERLPIDKVYQILNTLIVQNFEISAIEFLDSLTYEKCYYNELSTDSISNLAVIQLHLLNNDRIVKDLNKLDNFCVYNYLQVSTYKEIDFLDDAIVEFNYKATNNFAVGKSSDFLLFTNCQFVNMSIDCLRKAGCLLNNKLCKRNTNLLELMTKFSRVGIRMTQISDFLKTIQIYSKLKNLKPENFKVLCQNRFKRFEFVNLNMLTKTSITLPILFNNEVETLSTSLSKNLETESDLILDYKFLCIKEKQTNWVAARLTFNELFSTDEVFKNSNNYFISKCRLSDILNSSNFDRLCFKSKLLCSLEVKERLINDCKRTDSDFLVDLSEDVVRLTKKFNNGLYFFEDLKNLKTKNKYDKEPIRIRNKPVIGSSIFGKFLEENKKKTTLQEFKALTKKYDELTIDLRDIEHGLDSKSYNVDDFMKIFFDEFIEIIKERKSVKDKLCKAIQVFDFNQLKEAEDTKEEFSEDKLREIYEINTPDILASKLKPVMSTQEILDFIKIDAEKFSKIKVKSDEAEQILNKVSTKLILEKNKTEETVGAKQIEIEDKILKDAEVLEKNNELEILLKEQSAEELKIKDLLEENEDLEKKLNESKEKLKYENENFLELDRNEKSLLLNYYKGFNEVQNHNIEEPHECHSFLHELEESLKAGEVENVENEIRVVFDYRKIIEFPVSLKCIAILSLSNEDSFPNMSKKLKRFRIQEVSKHTRTELPKKFNMGNEEIIEILNKENWQTIYQVLEKESCNFKDLYITINSLDEDTISEMGLDNLYKDVLEFKDFNDFKNQYLDNEDEKTNTIIRLQTQASELSMLANERRFLLQELKIEENKLTSLKEKIKLLFNEIDREKNKKINIEFSDVRLLEQELMTSENKKEVKFEEEYSFDEEFSDEEFDEEEEEEKKFVKKEKKRAKKDNKENLILSLKSEIKETEVEIGFHLPKIKTAELHLEARSTLYETISGKVEDKIYLSAKEELINHQCMNKFTIIVIIKALLVNPKILERLSDVHANFIYDFLFDSDETLLINSKPEIIGRQVIECDNADFKFSLIFIRRLKEFVLNQNQREILLTSRRYFEKLYSQTNAFIVGENIRGEMEFAQSQRDLFFDKKGIEDEIKKIPKHFRTTFTILIEEIQKSFFEEKGEKEEDIF